MRMSAIPLKPGDNKGTILCFLHIFHFCFPAVLCQWQAPRKKSAYSRSTQSRSSPKLPKARNTKGEFPNIMTLSALHIFSEPLLLFILPGSGRPHCVVIQNPITLAYEHLCSLSHLGRLLSFYESQFLHLYRACSTYHYGCCKDYMRSCLCNITCKRHFIVQLSMAVLPYQGRVLYQSSLTTLSATYIQPTK